MLNTSKREFTRAEDSMREKLRAKIRQRIHKLPTEGGDENVNTLNQEKSVNTRRERGKTAPSQDEKVSLFLFIRFHISLLCVTLHRNMRKKHVEPQR